MYKFLKRKSIIFLLLSVLLLELVVQPNNIVIKAESILGCREYQQKGFNVTYQIIGGWDNQYNVQVQITNTSNMCLDNWTIGLDLCGKILSIWNASVLIQDDDYCVIENAGWNQDIDANQNVTFGFVMEKTNQDFKYPNNFVMLMNEKKSEKTNYKVTLQKDDQWKESYNGTISIQNISNTDIKDWTLQFDFKDEITNIWDAEIVNHTGNTYLIKNARYNQNIKADGGTITFGFQADNPKSNESIENIELFEMGMFENTKLSDDDKIIDTDNDGLSDTFEENVLFTDPNLSDTDGDLLGDYYEYIILKTNPLLIDTDSNGIEDGKEDFDKDKLSNYEEFLAETDPFECDTDEDDLSDYDEVSEYNTNPLNFDTDGDELSDGEDVELGFSPLLADSNNNGIIDSKEKLEQTFVQEFSNEKKTALKKVTVKTSVAGNFKNSIIIDDLYGIDMLSTDVQGLIGVPVDIDTDVHFKEAELTFYYDESILDNVSENDLGILWYDEENQNYVLLDSKVNTSLNTVSTTTTHFSTYMMVDKSTWYEQWSKELDYRNTDSGSPQRYYDIGFVVDVSGSMYGSRLDTTKIALNNFLDSLYKHDRAALIKFESNASLVCSLDTDQIKIRSEISKLYANGFTNAIAGINKGIEHLVSRKNENSSIIILLCDGDISYNKQTVDNAVKEGIKIYTINVGYSSSESIMKRIAEETGGKYYYATISSEIDSILCSINRNTIGKVNPLDCDNDGLADVYEKLGMRLANGKIIHTNPDNPDTDGDGILDGKEILPTQCYSSFKPGATYFKIVSDPLSKNELILPINESTLRSKLLSYYANDIGMKWRRKYSATEAIDLILRNSSIIEQTASDLSMPMAAIQAILFREIYCIGHEDAAVDALVTEYYSYKEQLEAYFNMVWWKQLIVGCPTPYVGMREDSSTGLGQIFAKTAINAHNFCIKDGVLAGDTYDYNDWKDRKEVWYNLKDDDKYNIQYVGLVLYHAADMVNVDNLYKLNSEEAKKVLARYNGTNSNAKTYGGIVYKYYRLFNQYNAKL